MITLSLSSKETKKALTKELALGHFKKRFCPSDFGTGRYSFSYYLPI